MFLIEEKRYTIVLPFYGKTMDRMSPKQIENIKRDIRTALFRRKQILIMDDYFHPWHKLFFVHADVNLNDEPEQLHDSREPDGQATSDTSKQVLRFSKKVLGLGSSGAPLGDW